MPPRCLCGRREDAYHVVACALAERKLKASEKTKDRRKILHAMGVNVTVLTNIDFLDAAMCAMAANSVSISYATEVGNPTEGYLIYPSTQF